MSDGAFREAVCRAVDRVPRGQVATYRQIAWMTGYPRRPRQVGMVLRSLPEGTGLPWHRIINSQGQVSRRVKWWGALLQIEKLREEGIQVDDEGRLDLATYGWNGDDEAP